MHKKKLFALLITGAVAMAAITGCSSQNSGSSSTGSQSSSQSMDRLEKIKQSGEIVFVTSPDYAPYEFIDLEKMGQGDAQYVGADVELARYIAQELGVELVIQPMSFDSVLASVTEDKCDIAISGIASKPERAEKMDFSIPYKSSEENSHGILIQKEDKEVYTTLESLNQPDIKVGAQNGSIQMEGAQKMIPNAQLVAIASLGDGVMQVDAGKIDALVISKTTGAGYCGSYPNLTMADVSLDLDSNGSAVAIPKGNPELLAEVNRIIEQVHEESLYQQWLEEAEALAKAQQQD